MTGYDVVSYLGQKGMYLMLLASMPPILVGTAAGLAIAVLQALTQIQEQTLGFTIKLIGVISAILMSASTMGAELTRFFIEIFEEIARH